MNDKKLEYGYRLVVVFAIGVLLGLPFGNKIGEKRAVEQYKPRIARIGARVDVLIELSEAIKKRAVKAEKELESNKTSMAVWSGLASFYADRENGKPTASGPPFNMNRFTAAHRTLPFGTHVLVLNMLNSRWTMVEITDRGPGKEAVEIDLSRAAARELQMTREGRVPVTMFTLGPRLSTQD